MSTVTKIAMGMMGKLRPKPALGDSTPWIRLPPPSREPGMPLMQALEKRCSQRHFSQTPLSDATLSDLLWAACGVNRSDGGRTMPSAMNAQEIDVFVALPSGAYRYEATDHTLHLVAGCDLRAITGYQDFVDEAPLDLVYVSDHSRMHMIPVDQRVAFAYTAAGAIAQNVYLYAASNNLATVIRAWIDRDAIANALGITHDQQVLLSQTVGYPGSS